jgi:prepilin-type N-terminal cleavage/methylation domain-containing protein
MGQRPAPRGYTLIEIVVAIFVFAVGALALAASSAFVSRELLLNARRERATRLASSRLEQIRAECPAAKSGLERYGDILSIWSVDRDSSGVLTALESVSYPASRGARTDTYHALIACSR